MSSKDIRELVRRLERQGFTVRRARSGHLRITSPDGVTITAPSTPGKGCRSERNMRANLRRYLGAEV